MNGYPEYKSIELPWLSQIPSHWKILRNKNIFKERKNIVGDKSSNYTLLSLTLNGIIPRDIESGKGKFPKDFYTYKIVSKGDMVFCLFDIDETPRTVGLSEYEGMLTGAYSIFKVKYVNKQYVYYYYLAFDNLKALRPFYTGLRKTISMDVFLSMKIPIPPCEEQAQIVRFLDWKVSSINKLIFAHKKQNEKLEILKNSKTFDLIMGQVNNGPQRKSDVSWVNTIPENWHEALLIQLAEEQQLKNKGMVESNLLSLSYGKIIKKDIHTTEGLLPTNFEGYQIVRKGNIILRLTDLQNDHKSLRTGLVTQTGIITSAYVCLRAREGIIPEYLQLQLHVADICKVFYGMGGGVRQSIGFRDIRKLVVAIPPIEQQYEIVEHAHRIEESINQCIRKNEKAILVLNELKERLILDVVTGKIDVRNVVIPEYEHTSEAVYEDDIDDLEEMEGDDA